MMMESEQLLNFPDQRRHRKRLQLGLFYSPHCGGVVLYAQPGAGRSQRVSPSLVLADLCLYKSQCVICHSRKCLSSLLQYYSEMLHLIVLIVYLFCL